MDFIFILFVFLFTIAIIFGVCALFVWICYTMAKSKGLPKTYMWFGLLGVIGIIVVAVSNPSYPQYPTYPQNQQNGYGQNPPYQQNTYSGNNQYQPQQPQVQQPVQPQQQNVNFCPNCGAPTDNYSVTCSQCGKMLR